MAENPVERETLDILHLPTPATFDRVEVRRITIAPSFHAGAHWHNGPVFGVIESGSVYFQVGQDDQVTLHPGETFYEPACETISRFDATEEGVTFLGWFPLHPNSEPELTMGDAPS